MAQLNSLIVTGDSRFLNTINGNITSANGIHRATMETSSTATAFVLTADGIDSLYDGLIITCKNIKIASAANCTINLNGLGAKRIWLSQGNNYCTTHWGLNQTYLFIYDSTNERWELQQGRDTDANTDIRPSAYCDTAANTAAKVASCTNYTATANTYLHVLIRYANTSATALTLNVNSQGAKPIYINNSASSTTNYTLPAGTYIVWYNGTNYYFKTDGTIPHIGSVGETSGVVASGSLAHAEGYLTSALGSYSHAEGWRTCAKGNPSHSEGVDTTAYGYASHTEGYGTKTNASYTHAEGQSTYAYSESSHAEGNGTSSRGNYSHAEGYKTCASGSSAHAEGSYTYANGDNSHAEGSYTYANGSGAHAEGRYTYAMGEGSHVEGGMTTALNSYSHSEGYQTCANANYAHAEGHATLAAGEKSHTEGYKTTANNSCAHAEGYYTSANAVYSHAEGQYTYTNGNSSHAEGYQTTASGYQSHAEGSITCASGTNSHTEGYHTYAIKDNSHAEGSTTTAGGNPSHAEGQYTYASGNYSHAEGFQTTASGMMSHSEGCYTSAIGDYQHVEGKYNLPDANMAHIIGGGTNTTHKKNIFTVDWNGSVTATGRTKSEIFNSIITGTGTAAQDKGSGVSPRYFPAKWTFNTGFTATDGDIVTIKIPVAGHDFGIFMTIDNGTNYYPVVGTGNGRITTHYPINTYITVVFEPSGSAASVYPVNGGNSRVTVSNGAWRVINYYSDGNDTTTLRSYYSRPTAGGNGVKQYSLFARMLDGANTVYSSFTTGNGTDTKTFDTTHYFDIRKIYYHNSSGNIASGSLLGNNAVGINENLVDGRYTFNSITTSAGFTANKPLYVVFDKSSPSYNCYKIKSPYWTHTPNDTNAVYVLVGFTYDTYRFSLLDDTLSYEYKDSKLVPFKVGGGEGQITNALPITETDYNALQNKDNSTIYNVMKDNKALTLFSSQGDRRIINTNKDVSNYEFWYENLIFAPNTTSENTKVDPTIYTDIKLFSSANINRNWQLEFKITPDSYGGGEENAIIGTTGTDGSLRYEIYASKSNAPNFPLHLYGRFGNDSNVGNVAGKDVVITKSNRLLTVTADGTQIALTNLTATTTESNDYKMNIGNYRKHHTFCGIIHYIGFKWLS